MVVAVLLCIFLNLMKRINSDFPIIDRFLLLRLCMYRFLQQDQVGKTVSIIVEVLAGLTLIIVLFSICRKVLCIQSLYVVQAQR